MLKTIAFIESNTTGTGFLFLKKAILMGFDVIFLTQNKERYSFLSDLNLQIININSLDEEAIIKVLNNFSNLAGVFSTSEYSIEIVARVAKRLGLQGNNVESIIQCRNKRLFYEALKESSFRIPRTWFMENKEQLIQHQNDFSFPVVVKPVAGTGSMGVKKCSTFFELIEHSKELFLRTDFNEKGKIEKGVIIQQYIEGPEFSAEILGVDQDYYPLGITAKQTTDNDYFIETGHDFPAPLLYPLQSKIWFTLKSCLKFLNFIFGPAHIEFKLQGSQVIFIEINPRLAGGMIPQLICYSCQIDLYEMILNLYTRQKIDLLPLKYEGASIRFFVAKQSGKIIDIVNKKLIEDCPNIVEVHLNKTIGDQIHITHDYRDRIGYLITTGSNSIISGKAADNAIKQFFVNIELEGRLSEEPHPLIRQILRTPKNKHTWMTELQRISSIDLAHILMLVRQNIIEDHQARLLISTIQNFQKDLPQCFDYLDFSRGTYYAYEYYLKEKLGLDTSGINHIGRSRNDINTTLFHFSYRDAFLKMYKKVLEFSETILTKARESKNIPLPIYSQYQPAMPGNYAFYLLAINNTISRTLKDLEHIESHLNTSPLGTGTGCGTDIPIDPLYVANLLGFDSVFINALDAIANRDFSLRFHGILTILGITLSRIAQDFQLWTTQEFHFFDLPDNLCGSSSMMPQKKNPYILEIIKTKTANLISHLSGIFIKMHKVPIGNSIEVSSAAYDDMEETIQESLDIINLLTLVIDKAQPVQKNMIEANRRGLTISNYVANQIMKQQSISFRQAHLQVGKMIRTALENQKDPYLDLVKYLPIQEEDQIISYVTQELKYGGGPSPSSLSSQIKEAEEYLSRSSDWLSLKENRWLQSIKNLNHEVETFLTQ